jgi:hypothetical protein
VAEPSRLRPLVLVLFLSLLYLCSTVIIITDRTDAINRYIQAFLNDNIIEIPFGKLVRSVSSGTIIPSNGISNIVLFLFLYIQPYFVHIDKKYIISAIRFRVINMIKFDNIIIIIYLNIKLRYKIS